MHSHVNYLQQCRALGSTHLPATIWIIITHIMIIVTLTCNAR